MKKRFIAGAVCPRCSEQDKIVMYDNDQGDRYRECVVCDFKELLVDDDNVIEPVTRVNKGMVRQVDAQQKSKQQERTNP